MSVKKEYHPQVGKLVEAMAGANFTQKRIRALIPEVGRADIENKEGLYRADWERGLALHSGPVISAYLKMAASGKCWAATKFWLATKGHIIEPTELQVIEIQKRPDIQVTFGYAEDEPTANKNVDSTAV